MPHHHPVLKAAAACTLAALATAAFAQAPAPLLRLRLNADIRSTDPGVNRDFNTDVVVLHMVEGLVGMREDTTPGPLLASKIETSKDGKTYTFKLRDGITFHNGAPLTADDVVWSWKRYLAPATQWRCLPDFDGRGIAKVTSVNAPDAKTVVFTLEKPTALFLTTMARLDCGGSGIVHRSSVGADGKWIAPIGTGPFKFGDWKRGQYVELQRFAAYASRSEPMDGLTGGKKAEVERLRFLVIPDEAAAKAALLSNGIDLLTDIGVAQLGDLNGQPNVAIEKSTTANLNAILIQTRDPLLKDVRIRRALALSIDTPELVRGVTNALARPNNSMIPVVSPYYSTAQTAGFKSDIAQAKKLLAEAGYTGQPIKMLTNKRYMASYDTAVLAQAFAARAGIKIDIEVLDWATQLDRYTKGDYQTQAFSFSPRLDPSLSFEMVTGPKAAQPRKVWDNPEVQAKLVESMEITDKVKRQAVLDDLHKRMLDEVPLIPLYNGLQFVAANKRVQGLRTWPAEVPRLWNVHLR
jgi:peptide/nickel transport system substrate-binding protein